MTEFKFFTKQTYSPTQFSLYTFRLPTSRLLLKGTACQSANSSTNLPHFLEAEVLFVRSLRPATGVHREPHQSYNGSFKIHFNIIIHRYSQMNGSWHIRPLPNSNLDHPLLSKLHRTNFRRSGAATCRTAVCCGTKWPEREAVFSLWMVKPGIHGTRGVVLGRRGAWWTIWSAVLFRSWLSLSRLAFYVTLRFVVAFTTAGRCTDAVDVS